MANRLAIFDCDGTLVDSAATIHATLADCLEANGYAAPVPAIARQVIGLNLTEAMAKLLPNEPFEQHRRLAEDYKQAFRMMRSAGLADEPLFDNVVELLDRLEEHGWRLAIATGKSDRGLKHCVARHDLGMRFISLQTADRYPSKPHPSMALQAMADSGAAPATTVVIGDTTFDMKMAVAAGASPIGAAWGYHEARDLSAAAVAHQTLEVVGLIRSHIGGR